jgi:Zn-dependent protease/CBS domain-containing protein
LDHALSSPAEATRGVTLFRISGIRIRLDRSWYVIGGLVFLSLSLGYFPGIAPDESTFSHWLAGLLATLLLFASILVHELAHSWAALRAGIAVPDITLFLFGGVSRMAHEPKSPGVELRIAIVGPLMSFALALLFWLLRRTALSAPWMNAEILGYLTWINLALGIFNLLPGYPLDGGRVLRAVVWWRTGSLRRATKVASNAGQAFAIGLMLLGALEILSGALIGGLWLILIAMFVRGVARRGYEDLLLRSALSDVDVARIMVPRSRLLSVSPDLSLRDLVDDWFLARGYRGYPVIDGGRAVGLVSIEDVREVAKSDWPRTRVADVMAPIDERTRVAPDASLLSALERITHSKYRRLLVMRDDQLEGLLSAGGISRYVELRNLVQDA